MAEILKLSLRIPRQVGIGRYIFDSQNSLEESKILAKNICSKNYPEKILAIRTI